MDALLDLVPPGVWGADLAVAAATLLAAGLIRGFSGFGSAMVTWPGAKPSGIRTGSRIQEPKCRSPGSR
jgi:hypothetical protein